MTLLSLSRVAKRFANGTQALDNLSFDIGTGAFVSLLGPSGCGKSTALRLAAGLLEPDGGTITYPQGKPEIGFVFQDATLMPWADALTNRAAAAGLETHASRPSQSARGRGAGPWGWRVLPARCPANCPAA